MNDGNYSNNNDYNESSLINNPLANENDDNNNYDINIDNNDHYQNSANENYLELQNQLINTRFIEKISPQEIYEILNDLIPSIIYSLLIYFSFKKNGNYCDTNIYLILKTLFCIYIGFILSSLFRSFLIYKNLSEKNHIKTSLIFINAIISTFFFFSIFMSYFIYSKTDSKCFIQDYNAILVFYSLLFLGLVNIFHKIINFITVCVCFILMAKSFLENPSYFYAHYGVDPEIIKNLPTVKADKKHASFCVICTEDIKEGDDIMILKCPGKHFFHGNCIKEWLLVKTTCPICRSENVL
jgi:hypothetical protein